MFGFSKQSFYFSKTNTKIQNEIYTHMHSNFIHFGVFILEVDTYVRNEYIQGLLLQNIGKNPGAHQ